MKFSTISAVLLAGTVATAAPTNTPRGNLSVSAAAISAIAPKSSSCDGAPKAGECRTSQQAASAITKAMAQYSITSPGEAAAVIATMAFESAEFKYQRNYYPGRPGQGTRNMQMITYNLKYARSIPALKKKLTSTLGTSVGAAATSLSTTQQNAVRDLLLTNDAYDFGSGFWFLTTACTPQVRQALQAGTDDGFNQYVTGCVGTTMTDDRKAYWTKAKSALS